MKTIYLIIIPYNYYIFIAAFIIKRKLLRLHHSSIHRFYLYLFIHSFILNIYIAPLQENYSEALPTPARLKRVVLS